MSGTTMAEEVSSVMKRLAFSVLPGAPKKVVLKQVYPHPTLNTMLKIMGELGVQSSFSKDEGTLTIQVVTEEHNEIRIENLMYVPECMCVLMPILLRRKRLVVGGRPGDLSVTRFIDVNIIPLREVGIDVEISGNAAILRLRT